VKAKRLSTIASLLLGAALLPLLAQAHHGWSGQSSAQTTVSGTVHKAVDLNGPHAAMQIMSGGQVWNITLAPSARTERAGLKPDTLKVGDPVTVVGNRSNDPKRFEMKTVRVTSGNKHYDVYPDRIK
jgi:Family of unknown function (DUF6152)